MAVHFGELEVDPFALSTLYQDIRDLADQMKASEKLSAAQNERDRRSYKAKFYQCIERLGNFYKKPIVKEEDMDSEVNCMELVRDILPGLTIENVEKLGTLLMKETGCAVVDPNYNSIMRRFHRVRYVM